MKNKREKLIEKINSLDLQIHALKVERLKTEKELLKNEIKHRTTKRIRA